MSLHLVTFLGTNDYKPVLYNLGDDAYFVTQYFPVALAKQKEPDRITVFLTDEAKEKHWDSFCSELRQLSDIHHTKIEDVAIPSGSNETELWDIFDALVSVVEPNTKLLFDITHGFRSLPVLGLLSISYLKFAKEAELVGLYYGAYEKRKEVVDGSRQITEVPVFDLTPFVDLLDWISVANSFFRYGDAAPMGELLKEIHTHLRSTGREKPREMQNLGNNLTRLSQALLANRFNEALKEMSLLENRLSTRGSSLEQEVSQWAKPFSLIFDKAISEWKKIIKAEDRLEAGLLLVDWYLRRGYIPQAVTLLRELVVSRVVGDVLGVPDKEVDRCVRTEAEKWLNEKITNNEESLLRRLWQSLRELRNDLAHAGFRDNPQSVERLTIRAEGCFKQACLLWNSPEEWKKLELLVVSRD